MHNRSPGAEFPEFRRQFTQLRLPQSMISKLFPEFSIYISRIRARSIRGRSSGTPRVLRSPNYPALGRAADDCGRGRRTWDSGQPLFGPTFPLARSFHSSCRLTRFHWTNYLINRRVAVSESKTRLTVKTLGAPVCYTVSGSGGNLAASTAPGVRRAFRITGCVLGRAAKYRL